MAFNGISLVTGAGGFLGRYVVAHLAQQGVKVRASARSCKDPDFFNKHGAEFVPADLSQAQTIPPLFEGNVDRVFHLGAICNFSTPYEKLYPTNVLGVRRITALALENKVKRFVHVSSTSSYGPYPGSPFTETTPRHPENDYGRSKKAGEDVVLSRMKEGLPAIITRPCTVYGPGCTDGAGKAFSRQTSITAIPGSGAQKLANIRVEDVAGAVVHLSELDEAVGESYNLADDSNPTLEEALCLAADVFGGKKPHLHLPLKLVEVTAFIGGVVAQRKQQIPDLELDAVRFLYDDYIVDNSKLKNTGFELQYPDFEASIRGIAA